MSAWMETKAPEWIWLFFKGGEYFFGDLNRIVALLPNGVLADIRCSQKHDGPCQTVVHHCRSVQVFQRLYAALCAFFCPFLRYHRRRSGLLLFSFSYQHAHSVMIRKMQQTYRPRIKSTISTDSKCYWFSGLMASQHVEILVIIQMKIITHQKNTSHVLFFKQAVYY